jgi:general secretion pathway protein M
LRVFWNMRAPRERMIIAAAIAVLCAVVYMMFVQSAERARARLRDAVTSLRAQAARLDAQANELERLRGAPAAASSPTDLQTLVQNQISSAGLARAVARVNATAVNQVQVSFGSVAFADWLAWVDALQQQQVRLDTCRMEALSTPGLVSVTATFARAKPP